MMTPVFFCWYDVTVTIPLLESSSWFGSRHCKTMLYRLYTIQNTTPSFVVSLSTFLGIYLQSEACQISSMWSPVLIQSISGLVVHSIKQTDYQGISNNPVTSPQSAVQCVARCLHYQALRAVSVVSIESMSDLGLAGCIMVNIVKV